MKLPGPVSPCTSTTGQSPSSGTWVRNHDDASEMTGTPPPAVAYCVSHSAISSSTWAEIAPGAPSSGRSSWFGSSRWSVTSWSMNSPGDGELLVGVGDLREPALAAARVASGTRVRRDGRRRAPRRAPGCRRARGTRLPRAASCRACPTADRTRGRFAATARPSMPSARRASTAYPARDAPPTRRSMTRFSVPVTSTSHATSAGSRSPSFTARARRTAWPTCATNRRGGRPASRAPDARRTSGSARSRDRARA